MPISKVTTGSITDSVAIDTDTLVVDSTNNRLGIGTTSPAQLLHVYSSGSDARIKIEAAGTDGEAILELYNDASAFTVRIDNDDSFRIRDTDGSGERDRLVIDGAGNLLVGKTTSGYAVDGFQARQSGETNFSNTDSPPVTINRNGTDGSFLSFYKSGGSVGSISTNSGRLGINAAGSQGRLAVAGTDYFTWTSSGFGVVAEKSPAALSRFRNQHLLNNTVGHTGQSAASVGY